MSGSGRRFNKRGVDYHSEASAGSGNSETCSYTSPGGSRSADAPTQWDCECTLWGFGDVTNSKFAEVCSRCGAVAR